MVKRKGNPQRASEEKRKCMTWSMDTMNAEGQGGSMSIISDDDPSLLQEIQGARSNSSKLKFSTKESDQQMRRFSEDLMHDMFNIILEECVMYIPILSTRKLSSDKNFVNGMFTLGTFNVQLTNESFTPPVPLKLPESLEYWLYVHKSYGIDSENKGHNMLYFESNGREENEPKENVQRVFWCAELDLPLQVREREREMDRKYKNIYCLIDIHVFTSVKLRPVVYNPLHFVKCGASIHR